MFLIHERSTRARSHLLGQVNPELESPWLGNTWRMYRHLGVYDTLALWQPDVNGHGRRQDDNAG